MERRQAEFLVKGDLPLRCVTRLGVIDEKRMKQVQELASQAGVALDILVAQGWYF